MTEDQVVPDSKTFTHAVLTALNHLEEGKFGVETFCTIIQNQIHRQAIDILVKNEEESNQDIFNEFSKAVFHTIDNLNTRDKEACKEALNKIKEIINTFNISLEEKETSKTK